jgi:hypothetical protein
MKNVVRLFIMGTSLLSFILGCSNPAKVSGGTSSETESTISGSVVYPDESPVPMAKVSLRSSIHLPNSDLRDTIRTTSTDPDGNFLFTELGKGYYSIEIQKESGNHTLASVLRTLVETDKEDVELTPDTLYPAVACSGSVVSPAGDPEQAVVSIYGLEHTVHTDAEGNFVLSNLPGSHYLLRVIPENPALGPREEDFIAEKNIGTIELAGYPLLKIEDFEEANVKTSLVPVFDMSFWYAIDDNSWGGNSSFDPPNIRGNFASSIVTNQAWDGSSLHVRYIMDPAMDPSWGIVGFRLGTSRDYYDLSKLDSIAFHARGSGTIRIEFTSALVLDTLNDNWGHFGADILLPAAWTRIAVSVDELRPWPGSGADNTGATWDQAKEKIQNINFAANDPAELWLDDVFFTGISVTDF